MTQNSHSNEFLLVQTSEISYKSRHFMKNTYDVVLYDKSRIQNIYIIIVVI